LEKRAEQVLPGSEGNGREEEGVGEKNEKNFFNLGCLQLLYGNCDG
jgi:hypothetical protein